MDTAPDVVMIANHQNAESPFLSAVRTVEKRRLNECFNLWRSRCVTIHKSRISKMIKGGAQASLPTGSCEGVLISPSVARKAVRGFWPGLGAKSWACAGMAANQSDRC